MAIARFLCALEFGLLVVNKRFQLSNLAILHFSIYTKMVNIFFSDRTVTQEGSPYFERSTRKLHSNDLV